MIEPEFISRFTTHLKEALQKALLFTVQSGRDLVEPGDLLVGILNEKGSIGAEVLAKSGIKTEIAEKTFQGTAKPIARGEVITPDLSGEVKKILERCILLAHLHEHKYVGTEHLVSAIIAINPPEIVAFFSANNVDQTKLKEHIASVLTSTSKFPDILGGGSMDDELDLFSLPSSGLRPSPQQHGRSGSALEAFSRELTDPQTIKKLDPVIGRDRELTRVIEILCRRTKNNPILLGEPGVGKTAIVEGLAQKLADGDVPDVLHGKRLLSIDLAMTVAGTMYRGEFEARLKQLVEEVKEDPDVILFIDEIHNLVGAGSSNGSLDAANILKPALARGEIHCIGATTWGEFKKHIESDAALERRFQPVTVEEPTPASTREMLEGLKTRYEQHHGVSYDAMALDSAVLYAERYLTDRKFPDKAIDLIDEAGASAVSGRKNRELMERLQSLEIAYDQAIVLKEQAVASQQLEDAEIHRANEQKLEKDLIDFRESIETVYRADPLRIRSEDIASVISRIANVPLETILASDRERLREIEQRLSERVIGQTQAISTVSDIIRRARLGLHDHRRPRVSMLFAGPSGTGKTELARTLAKELFGREDAIVKLDMSEYSEGYGASKLLGSPAGYVGYREGNNFTDAIRKRPHSVICFDEIEKAHPDVLNLLLQVLEDGQITDSTGRAVSFRQSYVILTSNVGGDAVSKKTLGFGSVDDEKERYSLMIHSDLKDRFKAELLNRLDRVVIFHPLAKEHMREIIRRELDQALERVNTAQRVACTAGEDVLNWLVSQPIPEQEGARAARRLIEREITSIIGRLLSEQPNKRLIRLKATKAGIRAN
jgi:ATP-dependent Clp protease ATP-binding subunit ClpC